MDPKRESNIEQKAGAAARDIRCVVYVVWRVMWFDVCSMWRVSVSSGDVEAGRQQPLRRVCGELSLLRMGGRVSQKVATYGHQEKCRLVSWR